jgi:hypothetical protein
MKNLPIVEYRNGTDKLRNEEKGMEFLIFTLQKYCGIQSKVHGIFRNMNRLYLSTARFENLVCPQLIMQFPIERMRKSRT